MTKQNSTGDVSPEERAAELADQIQALAFTAWAHKEPEHHEAAQKLAKKVVRLIREAENDALERAARWFDENGSDLVIPSRIIRRFKKASE